MESDKIWLDELRRQAYRGLFEATWGGWDEQRHQQHFNKTWSAGSISIIIVDQCQAGMIQIVKTGDVTEIAEIQILPEWQNRGLGTQVLKDVVQSAYLDGQRVSLYLGLMNFGAIRLYQRLGFRETKRSATHIFMEYEPAL